MATTTFKPQFVTGIGPGLKPCPGLRVETVQDVRDFLLGGPRVTDGVFVESGWADLVCEECGEVAARCPNLRRALPASYIAERLAARDELEPIVGYQHPEGLVILTGRA